MSLLLDAPTGVSARADHAPRFLWSPPRVSSSGREVVELAAMAGLELDDWQQLALEEMLGEREDGKWAASEVGIVVPRQNGKGSVLEARELAGLFLFGERLMVHSAHLADTSLEAFGRLLDLIEGTPEFSRRVKHVSRAHGKEGVELYGEGAYRITRGQRIRFRTPTKGGGRGLSGETVILDEAMMLPEATIGALMPVLSAQWNPQLIYTGSAVDRLLQENGKVLSRLRARGIAGGDPSLAYLEWSAEADSPEALSPEDASSVEVWARANPALRERISIANVEAEQRSMDPRTFAVERLNVGDWELPDGTNAKVQIAVWDGLKDVESAALDPVWFAIDVRPDRTMASISAAGRRADGEWHVELVDRRAGTGWVASRAAELQAEHRPRGFLGDERGPIASLLPELLEAGVAVETLNAQEYARACGFIVDKINQGVVRHRGEADMRNAIKGSAVRSLGDAWAWSRKGSTVDITPLVAGTVALWGWGREADNAVLAEVW